ncbi:hypothetical protein PVAND_004563 [Polypedilum vanderplanki]|uniref:Uncharacterized protein n=1 Tax=Polypedilum vanderplanki TaxID=319348 RepID=A0A9J6BXC1_POLVA|nr:hypothetical protein PVAND_004563 [Polypedilum vanderplanki]
MALIKFIAILFAILIINVKFSNSYELRCMFLKHHDGYNCHVSGEFTNQNEVTIIKGQHMESMSNSDVEVLFLESSSPTQYLPRNACGKFINLIEYECFGKSIIEISRENFDNCGNLNIIMINYAKFKTIPFDVFYGAPKLKDIQIAFTALESLPLKLFDNSPKLTHIDLKNNRLMRIDAMFPLSTEALNLIGNVCIDKNFSRPVDVIYEKCSNFSTTESVKNLQFSFNITKQEVNDLKEMIGKINLTIFNELLKINNKINDNDFMTKPNESSMKIKNIENKLKEQQELNEQFANDLRKINEIKSEIPDMKKLQNNPLFKGPERSAQEDNFQSKFQKRMEKNEMIQFILVMVVSLMFVLVVIMLIISRRRRTSNSDSLLLNEYIEN